MLFLNMVCLTVALAFRGCLCDGSSCRGRINETNYVRRFDEFSTPEFVDSVAADSRLDSSYSWCRPDFYDARELTHIFDGKDASSNIDGKLELSL
jgi:hypothetical protein